jgi:thiamine-phosphate pyrophosphorylase
MNIERIHDDQNAREACLGIYPILNFTPQTDIDSVLDWAVNLPDVGVKVVQVRAKLFEDNALIGVLDEIVNQLKGSGLTVILNDYVELVGPTGADGVHIGLDDFPVFEARVILGQKAIIGTTTRDFAGALQAVGQGTTYVACWSIYQSSTKSGIPIIGLVGLEEIVKHIEMETSPKPGWGRRGYIPVCAIGGINKDNLEEVVKAGASMVAVIGAVQGSEEPLVGAKELVEEWERGTRQR